MRSSVASIRCRFYRLPELGLGSWFFRAGINQGVGGTRAIFFCIPFRFSSSCVHHHSHRPLLEGHLSSSSTINSQLDRILNLNLEATVSKSSNKFIVPIHYPHFLLFSSLQYFIQTSSAKQHDQDTAIYVFVPRQRLQTPPAAQVAFISHSAKTL